MPPNETKFFNRLPHQRFIFLTQEAPPLIQHHIVPGCRDNYFNWTMSYRFHSDIQFLYGRIHPRASAPTSDAEVEMMIKDTLLSYKRYTASNSRQVKPFKKHINSSSIQMFPVFCCQVFRSLLYREHPITRCPISRTI